MFRHFLVFTSMVSTVGCTQLQLERSTVKQSATWTDLQYQQVLNNLAMFCKNPSAMPYFSVAGTGVTQVSDTASTNDIVIPNFIVPPLGGHSIWSGQYGLGASRQVSEQWSTATTTDPDKLDVIRCLYQFTTGSVSCDDCVKTINTFYGFPDDPKDPNDPNPIKWDRFKKLQSGWFHVGGKQDVPKNACYVGRYCDTYVWVPPSGYEGLTQFALAVLDVATADPAAKVVEHYRVSEVSQKDNKDIHTEKYHVQRYTIRQDAPHDIMPTVDAANELLRKGERKAAIILLETLRPRLDQAGTIALQKAIDDLQANRSNLISPDASRAMTGPFSQPASAGPTGRLNFFSPSQGLQFVPRR